MDINYLPTAIVLIIIGLIAGGIWFFFRWRRKRKEKKLLLDKATGIPLETLDIFNEAERRMKEEGSSKTPYQIMWDIARERNRIPTSSTGRINDISKEKFIPQSAQPKEIIKKKKIQWEEFK